MIPPLSVNPKLFLLLALFAQHKTSELSPASGAFLSWLASCLSTQLALEIWARAHLWMLEDNHC